MARTDRGEVTSRQRPPGASAVTVSRMRAAVPRAARRTASSSNSRAPTSQSEVRSGPSPAAACA
ncbi:hypothetical protein GCM10023100_09480 [Actinocorallia cavernae]|uniref:Uncharacterized protein n=2 Tax=Actinomycetes TaxID=1760 RepID=A0ABP5Z981_9ACTN